MRIAIDFDGTISAHPGTFGTLGFFLLNTCDVVVLTAGAGEHPPHQRPEVIRQRLMAMGLREGVHYKRIVCVECHEKGAWCAANAVDIMIDDETGRLNDIRAKSPRTVCLQCWPTRP